MGRDRFRLILSMVAVLCLACISPVAQADDQTAATWTTLGQEYTSGARELMGQFCLDCHSTLVAEGDLDLERFNTLDDIRDDTGTWMKIAEMLDNGEMPPDEAEQPSPEQRQRLREWVERYLNAEARANAGDPGPVVLRRLNNAQYTYTIRDLTGIELNPARTFPTDSAAGEGFTNTGGSLVMSPALLSKYFDAAKGIASHAVLLPDGFRFSEKTTRRDWTNEILADIREVYGRYTAAEGATQVNLQGIIFETNGGGRIPLEHYLTATIEERTALQKGETSIATVAQERDLNAKYLDGLWMVLNDESPSLLVGRLRGRWLKAQPSDVPALMKDISRWQAALMKFQSVGHMKEWMAPIDPLQSEQEIRHKIPTAPDGETVTLYLQTGTAGDGHENDAVIWKLPRLVRPGQPDILLRDVRTLTQRAIARRDRLFAATAKSLAAAAEAQQSTAPIDVAELAKKHDLEAEILTAWFSYLGIGTDAALELDDFTRRIEKAGEYDFIQGWGTDETPQIVANSSDEHVRIPGNVKPHGVVVHPSPTLAAAVGWRSPVSETISVEAVITHAHPECGNGVTWSLELRRGVTRERLATGVAQGGQPVTAGPIENLNIQEGNLLSLVIGPRDANHSCDLTDIELVITSKDAEWNLTRDISGDILAANPRSDHLGHDAVWHFYTEAVSASETAPVVPAGSILARWRAAVDPSEREAMAAALESLLIEGAPNEKDHPDAVLFRQLASLSGPLVSHGSANTADLPDDLGATYADSNWGLDPALFGTPGDGSNIDSESLRVVGPQVIEVRLPADLARGTEFVATAGLDPQAEQGSAQVRVTDHPPQTSPELWTDAPVLVRQGSDAEQRFRQAFEDFRHWFPPAVCYTKIIPVDEVVTLTLFHREDEPLRRLMLSESETAELDRLWNELHFVSHDAFMLVDAFEQLMEYATQDGDPSEYAPFREPIQARADAFRQALLDAEPRQLDALVRFASQVYRRPLADGEEQELRALYQELRGEGLAHEEAFRLTLARLFIAPAFLYRLETAPAGIEPAPVSDWELASRLSYFLTSSMPDAELRALAAQGRLSDPDVLASQTRRLLKAPTARRLASEFGCQWLQIYNFDSLDEKSERHFPGFGDLRDDMYEEAIRLLTDLFQRDGSILELVDGEYVIVNDALAEHYGIPNVEGSDWQRIDDARQYGRGGVLGLAAILSKQSGASRTSPILRGTWISDVMLGEKLPDPPAGVPPIPDGAATETLTMREITIRHTSDPACASCHVRIDPLGFSLEAFDAIGRRRTIDVDGQPINTNSELRDGTKLAGIDGLRSYIIDARRDAFVEEFCRMFLGYALGRKTRLSDEPLLETMREELKKNDYRVSVAIETIVLSPQFREIRGREMEIVEIE